MSLYRNGYVQKDAFYAVTLFVQFRIICVDYYKVFSGNTLIITEVLWDSYVENFRVSHIIHFWQTSMIQAVFITFFDTQSAVSAIQRRKKKSMKLFPASHDFPQTKIQVQIGKHLTKRFAYAKSKLSSLFGILVHSYSDTQQKSWFRKNPGGKTHFSSKGLSQAVSTCSFFLRSDPHNTHHLFTPHTPPHGRILHRLDHEAH